MKRYLKIILPLILWLGATPIFFAAPLQVSVTVAPQKYFLRKIAGNLVEVNVLVRSGADPHTYEPTPQQMVILSRSQLYFSVGLEFENVWLPKFRSINPKLKFIAQDEAIPKLEMEHDHNEEHGAEHDSFDPHIWLSPPLVKIQVLNLLAGLVEEDPEHKDIYQKNYQRFQLEIDQLYLDLKRQFAGKRINFAVFHPSWGYFAQAFGLRQIAIEVEGKNPKPQQLGEIIRELRQLKIGAIFVEPQFSRRSATVVVRAIKGEILVIDPLAEDWEKNLRKVADQLLQKR
jgi:zinc transport system substrate-binding protein